MIKEITRYNGSYNNEIRTELLLGLTIEQAKFCLNEKNSLLDKKIIRQCFKAGFSMEETRFCINNNFNDDQRNQLFLGIKHGLTIDQVKIYAKADFGSKQMRAIREGIERGHSIEELAIYANKDFSAEEIKLLVSMIDSKIPINVIDFFINHKNEYSLNSVFGWLVTGLIYEYIVDCINLGLKVNQIDEISEANHEANSFESETISMLINMYASENSKDKIAEENDSSNDLQFLDEIPKENDLNFVVVSDETAKAMIIQSHKAYDLLPTNQKYTKEFEDILLACYGESFGTDEFDYGIPPYFSESDIYMESMNSIYYHLKLGETYPELYSKTLKK